MFRKVRAKILTWAQKIDSAEQPVLLTLLLGVIVLILYRFVYKFYFSIFFYRLFLQGQNGVIQSRIAYNKTSIILEAIQDPVIFLGLFLTGLFLSSRYRELSWREFVPGGVYLRCFITFITLMLAITFSGYDYNLYLEQMHAFDRLLLLFVSILVAFHPVFLAVFLPFCLLLMSQFYYPLGDYSMSDKILPFSVLIIFLTLVNVACLALFFERFRFSKLAVRFRQLDLTTKVLDQLRDPSFGVFLFLIIVGAIYLSCGIQKIEIGRGFPYLFDWIIFDDFSIGLRAYLARGWLPILDTEEKMVLVNRIQFWSSGLLLGALVIECSGLLLLIRKWLAQVCLVGFCLLHLGIFAGSGIFFWKWIAVNIGLILLLYLMPKSQLRLIFTRSIALAGIGLMIFSMMIFRPVKLGWWYLRYYPYFRMEAVGKSGKVYALEERFMSPYELTFTFHRYLYLVDKEIPTYALGYESLEYKNIINNDGIEGLKKLPTQNLYSGTKAKAMEELIARYFRNLNERGTKEHWLSWLRMPHHIWMFRSGEKLPLYDLQEPVERIRIRFVEKYFGDGRDKTISDSVVRTVEVS